MLHITPENVKHAKARIQELRDRAYDYFIKHNKKTNRVSQRWNNEITDKQAIRYIHKMYWYRYFRLQQGKNISEDVMETIAEYYHRHNVKAYFNETHKPKISSTDYYLINKDKILIDNKQRYELKKTNRVSVKIDKLSDRLLDEVKTGIVTF